MISWDDYFMGIADSVSRRSTCNRLNVGCVIVKNNTLVSTGYNGSISGHDHCNEVGHLYNKKGSCIRTVHAEQNALLQANKEDLKDSTAYITHYPCETCSKLLVQSGVKRVVYKEPYCNEYSAEFLKTVECNRIQ